MTGNSAKFFSRHFFRRHRLRDGRDEHTSQSGRSLLRFSGTPSLCPRARAAAPATIVTFNAATFNLECFSIKLIAIDTLLEAAVLLFAVFDIFILSPFHKRRRICHTNFWKVIPDRY